MSAEDEYTMDGWQWRKGDRMRTTMAAQKQLLEGVLEAVEAFVLTAEAEGQVSAAEAGFALLGHLEDWLETEHPYREAATR
jgi:hypothetical protein